MIVDLVFEVVVFAVLGMALAQSQASSGWTTSLGRLEQAQVAKWLMPKLSASWVVECLELIEG